VVDFGPESDLLKNTQRQTSENAPHAKTTCESYCGLKATKRPCAQPQTEWSLVIIWRILSVWVKDLNQYIQAAILHPFEPQNKSSLTRKYLWGLERVLLRKSDVKEEDPALVRGSLRTHKRGYPLVQVVALWSGAAVPRRVQCDVCELPCQPVEERCLPSCAFMYRHRDCCSSPKASIWACDNTVAQGILGCNFLCSCL
jgi:hypothetical protein